MKKVLIILVLLAVVLGIVAYFAVFSGTQIIKPAENSTGQTPMFIANTTTSVTSSGTSTISTGSSPIFQTTFTAPYPVTWTEGQTQFAVVGASFNNNELTVTLNIQSGNSVNCIPVDLRLVMDEQGDMEAPSVPASPNFPLGGDTVCAPAPNTAYTNQPVTFSVDPANSPYVLTTGDASNIYFEIATTTNNGLNVSVPQQSS